jgi:hypothetical protein
MIHLVDAQRLVAAFKSHDAFMPGLVFGPARPRGPALSQLIPLA